MRVVDRRTRTVARAITPGMSGALHIEDVSWLDKHHRTGRMFDRKNALAAAVRVLEALDTDIIATFTATIDENGWDWDDTQWEAIFTRDRDPDGTLWATQIGVVIPAARPGFDPTEPEPGLDRVHVTVRRHP